ncbi:MAG: hypothetical protein U0V74_03165 [Chitinophagales bacterium]
MKKVVFLVAITLIGFSSCKKAWTCQCTDNNGNNTYHDIANSTLHDANATCNGYEYNNNGSYNNCSLIQ